MASAPSCSAFDRQMRVDAGGGGRAVAEILLNETQVDAGLQQMGGPGMAQRMNRACLLMPLSFERGPERILHAALGIGSVAVDKPISLDPAPGRSVPDCDA